MSIINDTEGFKTRNNMSRAGTKLAQATRRLSSGNRVNSAADDAAGLAISEKLRAIDRGLRQGLRNVNDGINYLDTVDGCAQEMNNMLHRMKEIAVEAANGTLDSVDRDALDLEYRQLTDEIGQITDSAEFNGIPLFERHQPEYEKNEGDVVHDGIVKIDGRNNTLVFGYTGDGESRECTVEIPCGNYTAEELSDVIDTALWDKEPSLIIGVNTDKQLTIQCEDGKINHIGGNGASLFYDIKIGSSDGYLLGVTKFRDDTTARLSIVPGKNDIIEFRLGNNDDTKYSIQLDEGSYTRPELVAHMNEKLDAAGLPCKVEAVMQENSDGYKIIGMKSETTMTGLSGNFLMIDEKPLVVHSPIYDICCYSTLVNSEAELKATRDLSGGIKIERGRNDYFVLNAGWYDGDGNPHTEKLRIDLLDAGENLRSYANTDELVSRITDRLAALDCPISVENDSGRLKFTTLQYGRECKIRLDASDVPSQYMRYDLFDYAVLRRLSPENTRSKYSAAFVTGRKELGTSIVIPENNNKLTFTVKTDPDGTLSDEVMEFEIPKGVYTRAGLQSVLNGLIETKYPSFRDKLVFSVGSRLSLGAAGADGWEITSVKAEKDTAYSRLIEGTMYYDSIDRSHSSGREEELISYGTTDPATGRSNVISTAGKTTEAVKYSDYTPSTTPARQDDLLHYSAAGVEARKGKTQGKDEFEDWVDPPDSSYTPATLRLNNVLTQFNTAGTSMRDINFSLSLYDRNKKKTDFSVSIAKGSTAEQAVEKIRSALGGMADLKTDGNSLVFTSAETGKDVEFFNYGGNLINTAYRSSLASRGDAVIDGDKVYVPATMTLGNAGTNIPYVADSANDRLKFSAGGRNYDIRLEHRTYNSLADFAAEVNAKIAAADGGSALTKVTASGNSLTFTAPPKGTGGITIDSSGTCPINRKKTVTDVKNSPYYDDASGTVKEPASVRISGADSHFPMTVDSTNNTITMDYTAPDAADPTQLKRESLTITVPDGVYASGADYADAINAAIAADPALNGKIKASYSSSGSSRGLTFTTVAGGDNVSLGNIGGSSKINQYKKTNPAVGGTTVPGENKVKYPAYIRNTNFGTLFDGEGVEINETNDCVSINIDGTNYSFTLTHGVYAGSTGRNALVSQLDNGLAGSGATVSGTGELRITTSSVGSGASIDLAGDNTAPYFKRAQMSAAPQKADRDFRPCRITGKRSFSSIDIKDYCNEFTFDYSDNGNSQKITVSVAEGAYTIQGLAAAMQASIDGQIGAGQLKVGAESGKLSITGVKVGNSQAFSNFEGRLFNRVFQDIAYSNVRNHSETVGTTTGSAVSYIIGRNEMNPETAEEIETDTNVIIYTGLNDKLVFDLTYKGEVYKVDITIPAGGYDPEGVADAIRKAGRETLANMRDVNGDPLPAEYFHATIGLGAIGVKDELNVTIPSNDKLILSYILPNNGTIKQADAIIDGVRGSAAYKLFYAATQSPQPTRVIGKSDLGNGITIESGKNDTISFELDGQQISATVPAGTYTCGELSGELNKQYEALGCIVRTMDNKGKLMFYTTENGAYSIDRISGNGADDMFYGADKRDEDTEIGIHFGRRTDSYIWYNKTRADDHLMRINTTGVTTMERALKAIDRLDYANRYLLGWRSLAGVTKNRSEHTYERNQVYIENLEAADSSIRDADMPSEVAEAARQKLVMQAQSYVMAKQKENQMSVLDIMA